MKSLNSRCPISALAFLCLSLAAALAACAVASDDDSTARAVVEGPRAWSAVRGADGFCAVDEDRVESLLSRMSLRDKAAQLFVVGPAGFKSWTPGATKTLIRDLGLGGVFLQPLKNMPLSGAGDIARVVNGFNDLALSRDPAIPLLFPIDQEGGIPQALQSVFGGTDGPGNLALAAAGDLEATYAAYTVMGREVRAIGGNVAFAPTLDRMPGPRQRPMYTRTFGQTVDQVDAHAGNAVRGFQDEGVVACIKHFPGGGMAFDDAHYSMPVSTESEQEVRDLELRPFVTALAAGADMVMTTHVRYTCWDDRYPATFSKRIKVDLLRKELGFEGVLMTDDMGMGGVTGRNDLKDRKSPPIDWGEDINVLAIQTGSDMILYVDGVDADRITGFVDEVVRAVREGRLTEERIDESVRRILRLKQKYCLFEEPRADPERAERVLGSRAHRRIAKGIMQRGETLVRNQAGLWPLDRSAKDRILVISPMRYMLRDPGSTWANASGTTLGKEVARLAENVETVHYMPGSLPILMDRAADKARATDADVIVLATCNAHYDPPQIEMARKVLATGKPVIVISLATPFELMDLPEATTYLAVYSFRTLALESAAELLFGLHEPGGRLPVELPGMYPVGYSASGGGALD